jgi:hypothetical protein
MIVDPDFNKPVFNSKFVILDLVIIIVIFALYFWLR